MATKPQKLSTLLQAYSLFLIIASAYMAANAIMH